MQLMHSYNPDLAEADYLDVIDRKTASLFSAGCEVAAVLAGCSAHTAAAMGRYGRQLGIAFQIADDALDYGRGDSDYGKEAGDDLAEGKATLPLIRAMQHLPEQNAERMSRGIHDGEFQTLEFVRTALEFNQ